MELDQTFHALSDSTRRAILTKLAGGDATVGELAEPFDITLSAVSKHIDVLARARLVERRREGRTTRCRIVPGALDEAGAWMARHRSFWRERFDALERTLGDGSAGKAPGTGEENP